MPADEVHTVDGDEVEIYYIPDERNRYKPEENVIILDERLQEWPLAHETIKEHELGHAKKRNQTTLGLLTFELQTDVQRYFSSAPEWQAVREYLQSHNRPHDLQAWVKNGSVNHLRAFWTAAMLPLHGAYRAFVQSKNVLQRLANS